MTKEIKIMETLYRKKANGRYEKMGYIGGVN